MGAREFIGGPVGGGGYVGRTTEQQAELEQLQAKVDDTVDKSITALTEVNSAISTTYDTQLDALELTAEKSATINIHGFNLICFRWMLHSKRNNINHNRN